MTVTLFGCLIVIGHIRYLIILSWLRAFRTNFFIKSPLGIERQKKFWKFAILTRKPRSHVRVLIYRTWPICKLVQLFTISFHLKVRQKYSSARGVFSSLLVVWKCAQTRSFVFDISLTKFKIHGFNLATLFQFDRKLNGSFGFGAFFWNKTSDGVTCGTLFCSHSLRISSSISKERNYLRLSDPVGPWHGKVKLS